MTGKVQASAGGAESLFLQVAAFTASAGAAPPLNPVTGPMVRLKVRPSWLTCWYCLLPLWVAVAMVLEATGRFTRAAHAGADAPDDEAQTEDLPEQGNFQ